MTEVFECKGYLGSTNYVPPHKCVDKYSVIVNDDNYANFRMCGQCYGKYQRDMAIEKNIQEVMKQEDLEGILKEVGEEE